MSLVGEGIKYALKGTNTITAAYNSKRQKEKAPS